MSIHCFNFPGSTEANAHLIAAAPELYEALEMASIMLEKAGIGSGVVLARAALSRARGEV